MKLVFLYILLTPASPQAITAGAFPTQEFCTAAKPGFRQFYADFRNAQYVCGRPLAPLTSPRPEARR